MKKTGIVLTLIGLIIFIIGFIGGVAYNVFELITYYSDTLQDSIEFSAGAALLIVYQAIFIITGALIIAFSVVMLCKIKKNKMIGITELVLIVLASMGLAGGISSLRGIINMLVYSLSDSIYNQIVDQYLHNAIVTGTFVKALGCLIMIVGIGCLLIYKKKQTTLQTPHMEDIPQTNPEHFPQ